MIGARLDFLARMAGHQGAISLVADNEVPCPLLKSTSEFCQLAFQFARRHCLIVLRSEYGRTPSLPFSATRASSAWRSDLRPACICARFTDNCSRATSRSSRAESAAISTFDGRGAAVHLGRHFQDHQYARRVHGGGQTLTHRFCG